VLGAVVARVVLLVARVISLVVVVVKVGIRVVVVVVGGRRICWRMWDWRRR
jgi:hypothetical protein